MGEEVDMLTRLREFPSCESGCNSLKVCACATIEEAADTIKSLRASLTRVEEERDEAREDNRRVLHALSADTLPGVVERDARNRYGDASPAALVRATRDYVVSLGFGLSRDIGS